MADPSITKLQHPASKRCNMSRKDDAFAKDCFPYKVGGWERLNINPVHCEGGSLAAELWRVGDILRHITTRNPGIRAVQNISLREGLRTTDHGKSDAFWSCSDGRTMLWSQCRSGDGRPQATYVDPATRKIRRSFLAWVDSFWCQIIQKMVNLREKAKQLWSLRQWTL